MSSWYQYLPSVKEPTKKLDLKTKFMWTGFALVIYFALSFIPLYGLNQNYKSQFEALAVLLAASFGSVISLGIGPIVTASIILQLLTSAKIIDLDVSTEEGFEEAFIIYNGRTIEGVGGGVCQVSTTAFQAAFYAGFPILERVPHAYSVGYYEVGEGIGMDATVYSPIVDMKFQNDTPYHLLIETSVNASQGQITFRFYSTSDGRTVQKDGPYVENIVPHGPPIYEENPTLTPGTVKQVDYAQDGKDVTVYRIVYRDGEVLYRDTFFSQYIPWQAIYQVAPGAAPDTN